MHPKVVSESLGHASIGITFDTYSHVMPGMQEEAAKKIDAGLRAALATCQLVYVHNGAFGFLLADAEVG